MFDTLAILLLIPVFDRVIYPLATKLSTISSRNSSSNSNDKQHSAARPRLLFKIGCGFVFALLSVAVAGIVEIKRKDLVMYDTATISHCQHARDYDPLQFVAYFSSGKMIDKPAHCRLVLTSINYHYYKQYYCCCCCHCHHCKRQWQCAAAAA
jgi:POT family